MYKTFVQVMEFHKTFGHPIAALPVKIAQDRFDFRVDFLEEELGEGITGLGQKDLVEVADACTDLLYVVDGLILELGIHHMHHVFQDRAPYTNRRTSSGEPNLKPLSIILSGMGTFHGRLGQLINSYENTQPENLVDLIMCTNILRFSLVKVIDFTGLSDYMEDLFDEVHSSNMSKACKTELEAQETILAIQEEQGKCYYSLLNDLYIVYRKRDNKVMKSINYRKADLKGVLLRRGVKLL